MVKKLLEISQEDNGDVVVRFKPFLKTLLSPEVKGHLKAAEREFLLSLSTLCQDFLKGKGIEFKKEPKTRTKIEIK